jgi:hypothetical protein
VGSRAVGSFCGENLTELNMMMVGKDRAQGSQWSLGAHRGWGASPPVRVCKLLRSSGIHLLGFFDIGWYVPYTSIRLGWSLQMVVGFIEAV